MVFTLFLLVSVSRLLGIVPLVSHFFLLMLLLLLLRCTCMFSSRECMCGCVFVCVLLMCFYILTLNIKYHNGTFFFSPLERVHIQRSSVFTKIYLYFFVIFHLCSIIPWASGTKNNTEQLSSFLGLARTIPHTYPREHAVQLHLHAPPLADTRHTVCAAGACAGA